MKIQSFFFSFFHEDAIFVFTNIQARVLMVGIVSRLGILSPFCSLLF